MHASTVNCAVSYSSGISHVRQVHALGRDLQVIRKTRVHLSVLFFVLGEMAFRMTRTTFTVRRVLEYPYPQWYTSYQFNVLRRSKRYAAISLCIAFTLSHLMD